MLKAGSDDGATGENAIVYNGERVKVLMGPVAVFSATHYWARPRLQWLPRGKSGALKILLPSQRGRIRLAMRTIQPMQQYWDEAACILREECSRLTE